MLLARHACLDQPPSFPSYLAWFQQRFSAEDSSAAALKSSEHVEFFYRTLTAIVPAEPEFALRAQVGGWLKYCPLFLQWTVLQRNIPKNIQQRDYFEIIKTQHVKKLGLCLVPMCFYQAMLFVIKI